MSKFTSVFLFALLWWSGYPTLSAAPSTKEFAVAINQAGRQRMLSQKMSKEFLLICLKQDAAANRTELAKTVKLFDATLKRLSQGDADVSIPPAPTPEIAAQLDVVRTIWEPYRQIMETALTADSASPEQLQTVARESVHLVTEMDKAVGLYDQASQAAGIKSVGTVVNVAGRQRMLSQRMSKDILLLALKVETEATRADLQKCQALFDRSLKGLTDGDAELKLPATANKVIRQQLAKTAETWGKFSAIVTKSLSGSEPPDTDTLAAVAELNLQLLADCQKVVSSYETETY